jgi:transcriptional regulator GlxA family with amidase domain
MSSDAPHLQTLQHRRVGILVVEGVSLSSVYIFRDLIRLGDIAMARLRAQRNDQPIPTADDYESTVSILFASQDGSPVRSSCGTMVPVDTALSEAGALGLLYVPSSPPLDDTLRTDRVVDEVTASAVSRYWSSGTVIGAAGSGVVVLAQSGILNGRSATIHWTLQESFRRMFSRVKLDPLRQITTDSNILCAASLGSELALACQLMSRLNTNWVGEVMARLALPDFYEPETSGIVTAVDPASVVDIVVSRALLWIARNYSQPLETKSLAADLSVSERTLLRRFKKTMNVTPHAYMRRLRLGAAARQLQLSNLPIATVAARVGYTDVDFFRSIFRDQYGVSPTEYRRTARGEDERH